VQSIKAEFFDRVVLWLPETLYALATIEVAGHSEWAQLIVSVVASLLHSLQFLIRSRAVLHLEILALRHQLAVATRSRRPRIRFTTLDRVLWAWLSQRWQGWSAALHVVQPATVLAWHRRGFRLFWTWKSRHRTRRPGVPADVRALIREMSMANPLWRASNPRRAPEVGNLGESVDRCQIHAAAAAAAVANVADLPHQSCESDHGADFFVVPTVTFRLLFVLVILEHDRRRIVHVAVTRSSDGGLDGITASQCVFTEQRTHVPTARPRFGLCGRGNHHRGDEYSDRSYGAAFTVAERVR
jgi:putative transposase